MIIKHKKLELFGKVLFEKGIIEPPMTFPTPMSNEACFIYVIGGTFRVISESSTLDIQQQDSVLMKCGNYVGQALLNKNKANYHTLIVHFYPEVLKQIYHNEVPPFLKQSQKFQPKQGMIALKAGELLEKYIDSILFFFENPTLVNEELLILKLKELLLLLMNTRNAPAVQQIVSNLFSPQTHKFREIITAHQYHNVGVQQLALLTNHSISSFKRKFTEIYKDSPAKYLKSKKLEKAAKLLSATSENISNIAYDCGFSDIAHFSRSFKSKYGTPPSKFRLG
ncbi:MAG: helix-turn-helix transcriptional regulator [Flavobacteriales bacterium]|nr:helix-turn-helix transcriptional regulator [Flavobacteriales bacterium]